MMRWLSAPLQSLSIALAVCLLDILPLAWSVTIAGVLSLTLLVRFSVLAIAHDRLRSRLDGRAIQMMVDGEPVHVVDSNQPAMVAGILRPRIYLHPDTLTLLDDQALAAVVAHECAHARRRDPLRLLLMATLEPFARLVPGARRVLRTSRAHLEIAADRGALRNGATRSALARALLAMTPSPVSASVVAFASDDKDRLEALLTGTDDRRRVFVSVVRRLITIAGTSTLAFAFIHGQASAATIHLVNC